MSLMNDYSVKIIAEQRQREFEAAAAHERLARAALGERHGWWQRLRRSFTAANAGSVATAPATATATATATSRATRQAGPVTLREHPVSH
jgi:hypothetical protein